MVGETKRALEREAANRELRKLADDFILPASNAAGFMKVLGGLAALSGFFAALQNPDNWTLSLMSGLVAGGILFSIGSLVQYAFDLRTLALRNTLANSTIRSIAAEAQNA